MTFVVECDAAQDKPHIAFSSTVIDSSVHPRTWRSWVIQRANGCSIEFSGLRYQGGPGKVRCFGTSVTDKWSLITEDEVNPGTHAVRGWIADSPTPCDGARVALAEFHGGQVVVTDLIVAGVDVNEDHASPVVGFQFGPQLPVHGPADFSDVTLGTV